MNYCVHWNFLLSGCVADLNVPCDYKTTYTSMFYRKKIAPNCKKLGAFLFDFAHKKYNNYYFRCSIFLSETRKTNCFWQLRLKSQSSAKKLSKYHNGQQHKWISTQCNPQTDVYKIVELLEEEK